MYQFAKLFENRVAEHGTVICKYYVHKDRNVLFHTFLRVQQRHFFVLLLDDSLAYR